jgi:hypothetical protein
MKLARWLYREGRPNRVAAVVRGVKISESDWSLFLEDAGATMKALKVSQQECDEVVAFVLS